MHTVLDVRNTDLYSSMSPGQIWGTYTRALEKLLDRGDRAPNLARMPSNDRSAG